MGYPPKPKIQNANYDKVWYYIDKMLAETDLPCGCMRCRLDAVALALNTLPPHYFVDLGDDSEKELGSPWILIEMAAREAMEKVRKNPNHRDHPTGMHMDDRMMAASMLPDDDPGSEDAA